MLQPMLQIKKEEKKREYYRDKRQLKREWEKRALGEKQEMRGIRSLATPVDPVRPNKSWWAYIIYRRPWNF